MTKKKILLVNDASFLQTGYGVYGKELLTRLFRKEKYDICELGCYANMKDQAISSVQWGFIPNSPHDPKEYGEYIANPINEWGAWKFEQVCLFFKPDIVLSFRDYWMDEFINRSPYRKHFYYITMPTVDSIPQQDIWISNYMKADKVLTYTKWGKDVIEKQTNNKLKIADIAPPAANPKDYFPVLDKKEHKLNQGLLSDTIILGTIMRNQPRKLFQDLIFSFKEIIDRLPQELAAKTYLYCHTGYPDIGHDIPQLVRDCGVGNKILFTYECHNCHHVFPAFFRDARTYCQKCNRYAAFMPGSKTNIPGKEMGKIVNCFDWYIQYSQNEGFGMPILEAAYCNVPSVVVNYSAMSSIAEEIGAEKVGAIRYGQDFYTKTYRAMPDNNEFVEKMVEKIGETDTDKYKEFSKNIGETARSKFSYDTTAEIWEKCIDDAPTSHTWSSPPKILETSNINPPFNLSNSQFVEWCVMNILKDRSMMEDYTVFRILKSLNYGRRTDTRLTDGLNDRMTPYRGIESYSKQSALSEFLAIADNNNKWELARTNAQF